MQADRPVDPSFLCAAFDPPGEYAPFRKNFSLLIFFTPKDRLRRGMNLQVSYKVFRLHANLLLFKLGNSFLSFALFFKPELPLPFFSYFFNGSGSPLIFKNQMSSESIGEYKLLVTYWKFDFHKVVRKINHNTLTVQLVSYFLINKIHFHLSPVSITFNCFRA